MSGIKPIRKVLVANRGEIAVRIMRTLREMGIASVAVYSEADAEAPHVAMADEAFFIGPAASAQSYLCMDRILEAAAKTGADAIHPGYGFLSENPDFSAAVFKAGLVFIGPSAAAIRQLGNKLNSRTLALKHGVPVIPAVTENGDREAFRLAVRKMGYPVLIKAAAGGGGKGMRVVRKDEDFEPFLEMAKRESQKAFASAEVFVEKYLARPRHIEFQILADHHGSVVHLNERECSIQRRHQKIVEETPSPLMTPELRDKMGRTAERLAAVVGYVNAGTVEFIVDEGGDYFLLEMNTRLQVEHPVTELVLGLDLVAEQIRIAEGRPLRWKRAPEARGHALECRLYAEDPANGFLPSPGRIAWLREPAGPGVRNDCGVRSGSEVSSFYDPMISKLIVWGEDRPAAIARMRRALRDYAILGLTTNRDYLLDIIEQEAFAKGELHTGFVEQHLHAWQPRQTSLDAALIAAAVLPGARANAGSAEGTAAPRHDPWLTAGDWGR
ncbi:MAG: ATP-grasp domain-containing protein [Elusimicrobia bacterium]|nr:ATP-grasp domain-containing protein [Elusimicrobiota bacterium]